MSRLFFKVSWTVLLKPWKHWACGLLERSLLDHSNASLNDEAIDLLRNTRNDEDADYEHLEHEMTSVHHMKHGFQTTLVYQPS